MQFNESYIDLRVQIGSDIRTLLSYISYDSRLVKGTLVVPEGFSTDLGSIPQVLQSIFPKDGQAMFAYILHDYLYLDGLYSQSVCDDILEEAMKTLGVTWWRCKAIRNGLRVGGFVAYNKHRRNDEENDF